ncbi:MAG: hypothetical protein AB8H03_09375 [Saprospiraceae bacterium]
MEALALAAVGYLVKAIKDHKELDKFQNDFVGATVNWIRPLFLRDDDTEKDQLKDLKDKPDSASKQTAVKAEIQEYLEENPDKAKELQSLIDQLNKADIPPAGINITQTHYGSGDNVGGDKIVGK